MTPYCAVFGPIGWQELLLILAVVLLVFGPRRLPEIAEALGNSIRKFRSATSNATDEVKRELDAAAQDKAHDPERKSPQESEKP
jgi:TatA/E family protein of Tat protein translocase